MFTTCLENELFRANQTYNILATNCRVRLPNLILCHCIVTRLLACAPTRVAVSRLRPRGLERGDEETTRL